MVQSRLHSLNYDAIKTVINDLEQRIRDVLAPFVGRYNTGQDYYAIKEALMSLQIGDIQVGDDHMAAGRYGFKVRYGSPVNLAEVKVTIVPM